MPANSNCLSFPIQSSSYPGPWLYTYNARKIFYRVIESYDIYNLVFSALLTEY